MSRYFHHPPNPKAYNALTIWTEDGYKLHGLLAILFKLGIIDMSDCVPDAK